MPPHDIPADPLEWRPQLARQSIRTVPVRDPVCEPHWAGRHVLAHFDVRRGTPDGEPWLRFVDTEGSDLTGDEPAVGAELRQAVLAEDAVIDGWLTDQATRTGEGATIATSVRAPHFATIMGRPAELIVRPLTGHDRGELVAFVAVDLLWVDGQPLFDLPLLERKRLLDGLLRQSDLVRITPYTRPPVKPWLLSWQAAGFDGAILKASNSRYRPTTLSDEWTIVTRSEGQR